MNKNLIKYAAGVSLITGFLLFTIVGMDVFGARKDTATVSSGVSDASVITSPGNTPIRTAPKTELSKWYLQLVNQDFPLAKVLDVNVAIEDVDVRGFEVDERILDDLRDMFNDAREEGLDPVICSGYRSHQYQEKLYQQEVDNQMAKGLDEEAARKEAATMVALPGTSEHELGLAVDIVSYSYQVLDEAQQDTPEQQWLMENSWKYGFILRYPVDKSDITGVIFEPWHYRYVGKTAAKEITEQGITLEEYLDKEA